MRRLQVRVAAGTAGQRDSRAAKRSGIHSGRAPKGAVDWKEAVNPHSEGCFVLFFSSPML